MPEGLAAVLPAGANDFIGGWLVVIMLVILVFHRFCEAAGGFFTNQTPYDLQAAPRPLVVVASNERGLILRDAKKSLYTYSCENWISSIAKKQEFKPGDIFCP